MRITFNTPGVFRLAQAATQATTNTQVTAEQIKASPFWQTLKAKRWDTPMALMTLQKMAASLGGLDNRMFQFGIPSLIDLGILSSADDLNSDNPDSIGTTLIRMVEIAGDQAHGILYYAIPRILDEKIRLFDNAASLKQNFHIKEGNWLESLSQMARDGDENIWTFFQFGFSALVEQEIIRKNFLDQDLVYQNGSLSFELTRLPKAIHGGADYFNYLMPDCLARFEKTDAQTVAQFLKETMEPASLFYESGTSKGGRDDMRWHTKVRPFPSLLPLEDPATLLRLLAETRIDPQADSLPVWLKTKRGFSLIQPETLNDLDAISRYADFLTTLTQSGDAREKYLGELDLKKLTKNYSGKQATEIVQVAEILNTLSPSTGDQKSLGDRWLGTSHFNSMHLKSGANGVVTVGIDNLDEVYATYFILKRSDPSSLADIHFVWTNGVNRKLSLADLSRLILASYRLETLLGEKQNPLKNFFADLDIQNLDLDLSHIPRQFFDIKGLESVREEINKYTDNRGGDQFVLILGQAITTAPVHQIGIDNLVLAMNEWSKTENIRSVNLVRDVQGRYVLLAKHAATRVRDYFETNPEELRLRYDRTEIMAMLKRLERSVRPAPEMPNLAAPVAVQKPNPAAKQPEIKTKEWPSTKNIPHHTKTNSVAATQAQPTAPAADPFIAWLDRVETEGVSLSDSSLTDIRLDDPKTIEPLRKKIAEKTTPDRAERFVHRLYERYFREPIGPQNVFEYYRIAQGMAGQENNLYRIWGEFAGGRLAAFIRHLPEGGRQQIGNMEEMVTWLVQKNYIDKKESDIQKGIEGVKNGHTGYVAGKWWSKHVAKHFENRDVQNIQSGVRGEMSFQPVAGALPGFDIQKIFIEGHHKATLVVGDPKQGAKTGIRIRPGGGINYEEIEKSFGNRLQYNGPVLMVSGANKGVEIMVERGRVVNFVFDPSRLDGYLIIYPDGGMKLADKRNLYLSDLTRKKEDRSVRLDLNDPLDFRRVFEVVKQQKLSIVASLLFKNKAGEQYSKKENDYGDDRRLILEFADGHFGVLDTEGNDYSTNDVLSMAWRIPGVTRVLYCDTGMFDLASYYLYPDGQNGERKRVPIGREDADKSSNRLYFYTGEEKK